MQYAAVGVEVLVGSRSQERAEGICGELCDKWASRMLPLVPVENAVAARADLVVIATPWEGVLATIGELVDALEGKVVITMANALTRWGRGMVPLLPPSGSVTAAVALALPRSRVVGAFHHMPAGPWGDLEHPIEADVLITSDDRAAAREVVALVDRLPGLRGVDAGGLGSALAIEAMTATLVEINRRYKTHAAIKITGIEPHE